MNETATNPFATVAAPTGDTAAARSDQERSIREVEAAMVIAKRFPRDRRAAMDRILQSCTRVTLAEHALYAYPRGGAVITGPSIRLAECLAQEWGNLQFGIRELSQAGGESTVEAFAWDLETNTRKAVTFQVPHIRYTREKGRTPILDGDPRDIYELVANQGARRLRACILAIIPGDVVDAAQRQSELTMEHAAGAPAEEVEKMADAFAPLGVSREMLAKRLGHHLNATIAAEIISLRKIFASLRDGMAKPGDFFPDAVIEAKSAASVNERLKSGGKAIVSIQAQHAALSEEIAPEPTTAAEPEPPPSADVGGPTLDEVASMFRTAATVEALADAQNLMGGWKRGTKERQMLADLEADTQRRLGA